MATIGQPFPSYALKSCADVSGNFPVISGDSLKGDWVVYVFWPKDFTFVCPTEILAYDELTDQFTDRGARIVGVSTDTDFVHLAWRKSRKDLGDVGFPWLADSNKALSRALDILEPDEGVAYRATYIVDSAGIIRHLAINDLNVGRNADETLRVLDSLQNGGLCPAGWRRGEKTLTAA
jgi:alkyl hydroperoxide reductase subunit AhpC